MNDPHDPSPPPLSEAERAAFAALPRSAAVPPGLEDRVVEALSSAGILHRARQRRGWVRAALAAAAALTLVVVGFALGRRAVSHAPQAAGDRYVLLLRETAAFERPAQPQELVAEYRAWAQGLARQGNLELGEELAGDGALLGTSVAEAPVPTEAGVVAGLFIVRAESYARALALARSCPHLRHGGRIEVRRIQETGG